jgi:hypothetical protein
VDTLSLQGVPNVASEVIITSKQVSTRNGEGNGGDSAENIIVGVLNELNVGAEVEKTARSVIRAGTESVAGGEILNSVDIRLVSVEGLLALSGADVPELGSRVAGTRDEALLVRGHAHAERKLKIRQKKTKERQNMARMKRNLQREGRERTSSRRHCGR